jgi:DNA invertase Pin-like site-specific DNA recombinase
MQLRAGIYARISRDDLGDGLGVERQVEDCRAVTRRRDWCVADTYVDNDISAFSGRARPAYDQLVADLKNGRIDVVVAWAPERLHRSLRELEDFIDLVETQGTSVETVKAGTWDLSSSHGRLVARMLGAVSRAESERIGERVSRAHQQAKDRGLWRGPIPYGMRASNQPGMPAAHQQEAETVREIFEQIRRGDALTKIARELNARAIKPRRGAGWTHTAIERLISCPALGGQVNLDGELRAAAFDGVVSTDVWMQANAALRRRPRGETSRPRQQLTLLGGLLQCAEHGYRCYGGTGGHAPIYGAREPGQCFVSITRQGADALVTELVLHRLSQPDAAELFVSRPEGPDVRAELARLRAARDDIADLVSDGLLPRQTARSRLTELKEQISLLEDQQHQVPVGQEILVSPRKVWAGWNMPQRRAVLRLLFSKLAITHIGPRSGPTVQPNRLKVEWSRG